MQTIHACAMHNRNARLHQVDLHRQGKHRFSQLSRMSSYRPSQPSSAFWKAISLLSSTSSSDSPGWDCSSSDESAAAACSGTRLRTSRSSCGRLCLRVGTPRSSVCNVKRLMSWMCLPSCQRILSIHRDHAPRALLAASIIFFYTQPTKSSLAVARAFAAAAAYIVDSHKHDRPSSQSATKLDQWRTNQASRATNRRSQASNHDSHKHDRPSSQSATKLDQATGEPTKPREQPCQNKQSDQPTKPSKQPRNMPKPTRVTENTVTPEFVCMV